MTTKRGVNAALIDAEYRREQSYRKLQERQKCKDKKCNNCKFINICTNKE